MSPIVLAALAVLAPLAAALVLVCFPPLRRSGEGAALASLAATAVSLFAGLGAAAAVAGAPDPLVARWVWLPGAPSSVEGILGPPVATIGILLDPIAGIMLVVVAAVSLAVQLYSLGYLDAEPPAALGRYYSFLALFTFSMQGLVVAESLVQLFVCWELVGLCSYLLIGFWYRKPEAARAAQKAFWTTKLGDLGMLAGVVVLWGATGTFSIPELSALARTGAIAAPALTWGAFLLYSGAVGKSAQVPLHVWLPDAMEGPTPVSALIHAATMVAAGVYLVVRVFPVFAAVPAALQTIAWVGAVTALVAALLATVPTDIKRVLAYSTVSQLGFMMAALGAGAAAAGYFHLVTHAGFKALLFLAAGSVIHALGTNDLRAMGGTGGAGRTGAGLWRAMPQTALLFGIGALALAGIWPFAGFFSKDAVLLAVSGAGLTGPLLLLLAATGLTGFYITRVVMLAFFSGRPGSAPGHPTLAGSPSPGGMPATPSGWDSGREGGTRHSAGSVGRAPEGAPAAERVPVPAAHAPHESPAIMAIPMWALAVAAVGAGWFAGPFTAYLAPAAGSAPEHGAAALAASALAGAAVPGAGPAEAAAGLPAAAVPALALALAAAGLAIGTWRYRVGPPAGAPAALVPLARLLERRLYLDDLYEALYRRAMLGAAAAVAWVDRHIVDGAVNLAAAITRAAGDGLRQIQTGRAQDYVYGFLAGLLVLAAWAYWLQP